MVTEEPGILRIAPAAVTALASAATRVGRAATVAEAKSALRAVRRVARYFPAKVACMLRGIDERGRRSGFQRRHVGWRHGIASDPVRMHAWTEVDGQPVGEPPSTSRYTPLICLP